MYLSLGVSISSFVACIVWYIWEVSLLILKDVFLSLSLFLALRLQVSSSDWLYFSVRLTTDIVGDVIFHYYYIYCFCFYYVFNEGQRPCFYYFFCRFCRRFVVVYFYFVNPVTIREHSSVWDCIIHMWLIFINSL